MNQSPAPFVAAPRVPRTLSITARLLLWGVLAVWGLFALTLGTIHWVIVPRIDEARPTLERWVGKALGVPLKIGAIAATSESRADSGVAAYLPSLVPSFKLRDVRLYDPAGREALHLPQVDVAISVRSLWRLLSGRMPRSELVNDTGSAGE